MVWGEQASVRRLAWWAVAGVAQSVRPGRTPPSRRTPEIVHCGRRGAGMNSPEEAGGPQRLGVPILSA